MYVSTLRSTGFLALQFNLMVQAGDPKHSGAITIVNECSHESYQIFDYRSLPGSKYFGTVTPGSSKTVGTYADTRDKGLDVEVMGIDELPVFYLGVECAEEDCGSTRYRLYAEEGHPQATLTNPFDVVLEPQQSPGGSCKSARTKANQEFSGNTTIHCDGTPDFKLTVKNCAISQF